MIPYIHTKLAKKIGLLLLTFSRTTFRGSMNQSNVFAYGRGKKVEAAPNSQIWKQLSRDTILKELEIIDYSAINQQSDGGRQQLIHKIDLTRHQLIERVQEEITYVEENAIKINKYVAKIHITADILKEELKSITAIILGYTPNANATQIHELKAKSEILSGMLDFMLHRRHSEKIFSRLSYIIEVEIKLRVGILFFKEYNHNSDITNSPMKDYAAVWDRIHIETTENHSQIDEDYHSLSKIFHMMGGSIMKANKYKETLMEKVVFGFTLPLHMIKYEWSVLNSLLLVKNPTLQNGKKFMNLYEEGVLKHITEMGYGKIHTNQMIYISADGDFAEQFDIFKERKDSIPVRILYHKELPIFGKKSNQNETSLIEEVFVHIHGGGFVGLSSQTTQNYTRKWANSLKMPIFSIDYRMPPDHPFPQAPNDCLQVYKFITTQIHKYMRISPKNIYIGGDSAGGNITCAVTALILKQKLQKPNGLYIIYPSLDLRSIYYPSRKYILNDPLLWPSMIKLFLDSYVSKEQELAHPLASPLLLTEQFVNGTSGDKRFPLNWPLTYMTVGMKDPLRDDTLILMQRMTESQVDCKCYVFSHLRHGYMSTQALVKESKVAVNHSLDSLKEMIEQSKLTKRSDLI